LDLGSGLKSQFSLYIPSRGSSSLSSRVASSEITTGWAEAVSSLPIQGVVSYRFLKNGVPSQEISVPATLPSPSFVAPATYFLSLAVVNAYSTTSIALQITAHSNDGSAQQAKITLSPFGHQAFSLAEIVPGLAGDFAGTVEITAVQTSSDLPCFIALALKTDRDGVFSSLPSGVLSLPVSQFDRIRKVFANIRQAASSTIPSPTTIQLYIQDNPEVDASGDANGITIGMALAKLLA